MQRATAAGAGVAHSSSGVGRVCLGASAPTVNVGSASEGAFFRFHVRHPSCFCDGFGELQLAESLRAGDWGRRHLDVFSSACEAQFRPRRDGPPARNAIMPAAATAWPRRRHPCDRWHGNGCGYGRHTDDRPHCPHHFRQGTAVGARVCC